ncbi:FxLYD domain-containing protein [Natrinema amylolyticum]|uniref:FxLYD domain-containing protein n=1 Tax=Natrinema amylolyticum TaxID=2878679 RepID=UPI001CF9EA6E|nr:FxLYD domain-containing protein [Natrinema amylolyticum]
MQRRTLLAGGGTVLSALVAGCAADEIENIDGGTRDNPSESDGEFLGSADLEIVDHEMVLDEEGYGTDVYVEATVENNGSTPSGDVDLRVDWYDSDGNYLDNDTAQLTSLGDGERWVARVYNLLTDEADIDDYELEGEFSEDAYEPTDELSLVGSSMNVVDEEFGDGELNVRGEVSNDSDAAQSYVEAVAKIYDDDGNVLGDDRTNITDLPGGETWAFTIDYFSRDVDNRAGEAADHEILIKDSPW